MATSDLGPGGPVYGCPVPGCTWSMTDRPRSSLAAAVFRKLAREQGLEAAIEAEFAGEHARLLLQVFADHLQTHRLRPEQVRVLAGRMVRAALTA